MFMDYAPSILKTERQLIKEKIKELGLTQNHVAEQVGVSYVHLSYVLNDKKDLTEDLRNTINSYLRKVKTLKEQLS